MLPYLLLLFHYLPSSLAEYNANEHVVLAECGIGKDPEHPEWADSFYAFYYSGEVWTDASETAVNPANTQGKVEWDGSYPWRESGRAFKTENGDE